MNSQTFDKLNAETAALADARPSFLEELITLIPKLRAFARMLCGERELSEDLAQKTLTRACRAQSGLEPGTNMKTWLFGLFHDEFHSRMQPRNKAQLGANCSALADIAVPGMESRRLANDIARKLVQLPESQREALILVTAGGLTYEESAKICGTQVKTVKRLVIRARGTLLRNLDGDTPLS
jgi:RNA polymerase sigma-70 factor, ECF subfamily